MLTTRFHVFNMSDEYFFIQINYKFDVSFYSVSNDKTPTACIFIKHAYTMRLNEVSALIETSSFWHQN
jgi:hypothetical protein